MLLAIDIGNTTIVFGIYENNKWINNWRIQTELNQKLTVVATGGLSTVIAPLTKNVNTTEPMLTLDGLMQINSFL